MCDLTVVWVTVSRAAISLFVSPSAIRARTSRLARRQLVGQAGGGRRGLDLRRRRERGDDVVLDGGIEGCLAACDREDRRADVVAACVLGQVAACAGAKRAEHALVVGVGGERDDAHVGLALA